MLEHLGEEYIGEFVLLLRLFVALVADLAQESVQVDVEQDRENPLVTYDMLGLVESRVLVEGEEEDNDGLRDESGIPDVLSLRQLHVASQVLLELEDNGLDEAVEELTVLASSSSLCDRVSAHLPTSLTATNLGCTESVLH